MDKSELQNNILKKIQFDGLTTPDHQDLFSDAILMRTVIQKMADPFKKKDIKKVAAIDGAGFIFGALVAKELKAGLILIRKEGSTPSPSHKINFVDYSRKTRGLEIKKNALINKGDKLLLVDDWAETGAHLISAIELLRMFKPKIIGISLLINEMNSKQIKILSKYNIKEIINFNKIKKPNW